MKIIAVLLVGIKTPYYFEADSWQASEGLVRISKGAIAVAAFSVRNMIGIIDLSAGANISAAIATERLKDANKSPLVDVELLSRPRPGAADEFTTSEH